MANIKDIKHTFYAKDLAKGEQLIFTATGVVEGPMLDGVLFKEDKIVTHSIVARKQSGTIRYITTHHNS